MRSKKKLATSGSIHNLRVLVAEFYCSDVNNIELREAGEIYNTKLHKYMSTSWGKVSGRYIFWM